MHHAARVEGGVGRRGGGEGREGFDSLLFWNEKEMLRTVCYACLPRKYVFLHITNNKKPFSCSFQYLKVINLYGPSVRNTLIESSFEYLNE